VATGLTATDRLGIVGRSAGGLLMGAVVNQNPGLFKCAIAAVPFVDVMTTMSDPTIPLTVGEWEEWGNPNEEEYHSYMDSYSPIDNVKAQPYCSLFVTAGLNDPRVAYWEPAKWVAKMRDVKTTTEDEAPLLLKTDMDTGHFSASDRYKYMTEMALEQAYLLWQIRPESVKDYKN
jgi:oligopeptidase B